MIAEKLLYLIQPEPMLLEYLIHLIPQKNIELNELIKRVSIIWRSIIVRENQHLLDIIYKQLEDIESAHKYIQLNNITPIEKCRDIYGDDITKLLNNYIRIYKIYEIVKKYDNKKITLSNLHSELSTMLIEIQDELEKFTIKEESAINFIDIQQLDKLESMNILKYVSFIPEIDFALNGFSEGLYLFAGTLGSGKSSLLLNLSLGFNIFVNLYEDELKEKVTNNLIPSVVYITVENTYEQTLLRIKAILNDSSPIAIVNRDTPLKVLTELIGLNKLIIVNLLYEQATMTNIEKMIKQIISNGYHPTIIIFDYMDEVYILENIEYRHKFGLVSRFLRNLALKYKSVVITATQLNRKAFDGKISIASLSESIEHAKKADAIVMLVTGKTTLNNIKLANYRDLFNDNKNNQTQTNNPFASSIRNSDMEFPAMFLSVQKNRYNLILSDIGILTSPNCKIGFTSLIECLDFNISASITNLKSKFIKDKFLEGVINESDIFIKQIDSCYGKTAGGYYDIALTSDTRSQNKIFTSRETFNEIINNLKAYKENNSIENNLSKQIDIEIQNVNADNNTNNEADLKI
ncbi:MAG: DnaB-like helicase C-terminal domain-containing protein [Candidatus Aenigmatarchaeota archaeon]